VDPWAAFEELNRVRRSRDMRWLVLAALTTMVGCYNEVFPFGAVDGGVDGDTDSDGDGDADGDGDGDGDADAPVAFCPGDESMILIRVGDVGTFFAVDTGPITVDHDFCIDRYEASRGAADAAASVAGAAPWSNVVWSTANAACAAAGKRLCTPNEWALACHGPNATTYPYGPDFIGGACNGGDEAGDGSPAATGSHPRCSGGFPELYDMSGNVQEGTWDPELNSDRCVMQGGAFYSGSFGLQCHDPSSLWSPAGDGGHFVQETLGGAPYETVGFRCCADPPTSACVEGFDPITTCVYSRCCNELNACNAHWGQCYDDTECMFSCVLDDPSGSVWGCTLYDCEIENPYAVELANCIDEFCTNDQL
jgi:hypothetical protein